MFFYCLLSIDKFNFLVYSNYLFALASFFLDTSTAPTEASPNEVRIKAKFISEVLGFFSSSLVWLSLTILVNFV